MKCIYFNETNTLVRQGEQKNAVITAIVIDAEVREAFKENLNKIIVQYNGEENKNMVLKWSAITPENTITYSSFLKFFGIVKNVTLHARVISKFTRNKIYPTYVSLIKEIKEEYGDEIRVFVPAKKNGKRNMAYLKELLDAEGIECNINQNPLEESRFYQLANIIGGLISYYIDPFGYFEHIDDLGKSQITTFALEMKKPKGKVTINKD